MSATLAPRFDARPEAVMARLVEADRKRITDAAAANASAEAEAAHVALRARDSIAEIPDGIDERDAIVVLHALAEKLAGERNLPNGLCDLLHDLRGYCIALDDEYRECMGLGADR